MVKKVFVAKQFRESKTGWVTCECTKRIPLRFAYRCYYCGQYYCDACASTHFGKSREEYRKEHPYAGD